jgi:hypothetical protein
MNPVGGSNDTPPCMMEKKAVDSVTPTGAAGIFGVTISRLMNRRQAPRRDTASRMDDALSVGVEDLGYEHVG